MRKPYIPEDTYYKHYFEKCQITDWQSESYGYHNDKTYYYEIVLPDGKKVWDDNNMRSGPMQHSFSDALMLAKKYGTGYKRKDAKRWRNPNAAKVNLTAEESTAKDWVVSYFPYSNK